MGSIIHLTMKPTPNNQIEPDFASLQRNYMTLMELHNSQKTVDISDKLAEIVNAFKVSQLLVVSCQWWVVSGGW